MYREIGSAGAFGVMGTQVSRHLAAAPPPSHVMIRPAAERARAAGHPCADVYDHAAESLDRPVLPLHVDLALSVLVSHAERQTAASERPVPQGVRDAAAEVRAWRRADDCSPHGMPRPGGVA